MLTEVVEREPGVVVVGQADNALKAKSLARSLRPEVVVVDSRLPYCVGLDTVRLSRISGLDTAMDISQELPRSMVVLLPAMNAITYHSKGAYGNTEACFCMQTAEASVPFRFRELYDETASASRLVFADVKAGERVSLRQRVIQTTETATLYSGLATLGGLVMVFTIVFAGAGAFLAIGGFAALLLSLAGRAAAALWPKRHHIGQEVRTTETVKAREVRFDN
ncbi:MAG: hypothetical protein HY671_01265 [Chloroflexi bacterium]|nr:hypothetical protein [Chloroflexota bacterium]